MAQYAYFTSIAIKRLRRTISIIILASFISTSVKSPSYAQLIQDPMPRIPVPGVMVHLSPEFTPALLEGIIIHPENALKFDFIVNKGDQELNGQQKKTGIYKIDQVFLGVIGHS